MILKLRYRVYTLEQRCKDWFFMRIYRSTGTVFALSLLFSNHYRLLIGMKKKENVVIDENWQCKILNKLISLWFSSKR